MALGPLDLLTAGAGQNNFWNSFFGQSQSPDLTNPTLNQYMNEANAAVPGMANADINFNNRLGPAYAKLGQQVENIYDPNQAALRSATSGRILSEVQNPYELPPELARLVSQNALQGDTSSGVGASMAGRFSLGKSLGLAGMQLGENRISRAAQFTRSAPLPNQLFQPITSLTPSDALSMAIARNNMQNQQNVYRTDVQNQNTRNLIDVPLGRFENMYGAVMGAGAGGTGGYGAGGGRAGIGGGAGGFGASFF